MTLPFAVSGWVRRSAFFFVILTVGAGGLVSAQQLTDARVTQIIKDVKLLPNQAAPRPAVVNDQVKEGTAVRTGADSRTELTFTDLTITRLGANTVFSFKGGTRDLNLTSGAILVQVPPKGAEVRVTTAAVTAAISGGTGLFEAATGKFMVLEGIGSVYPVGHPELAITVHAGEMVWLTREGHISPPEKFNVALTTQTSQLITGFSELPNWDLIVQVIDVQKASGDVPATTTTTTTQEKTTLDVISQADAASSPTPTPTVSESPTPTPGEPSPTPIPTPTPSPVPTPTPSPVPTPTPSPVPTPTPSPVPTPTPSPVPTPTPSPVPTPTPSPVPTPTPSPVPTPTPSPVPTPTPSPVPTPTPSPVPTPTPSPVPTPTPSPVPTPTPSPVPTPTPSPVPTPTPSPVPTPTPSPVPTPTPSPVPTPTPSPVPTPTPSPVPTPTPSPVPTPTPSPVPTPTPSPVPTPTPSPVPTPTPSPVPTPTPSPVPTPTPSPVPTPTPSPVPTPTPSPVPTPTPSPVPTPTPSPVPTPTPSPVPTPSATPSASPTPAKTGTPATISSPNPYVINSGTAISTDPAITTSGQTDYGKLYRGPTDDGPFTQWAFGSTSAFDTALKLDTEFFADPTHLPIAVFKFENLSLNGNPTIDTSTGGTSLALIGADGITSGAPGGILTFTGLDALFLATVDGSINLGSGISFQGLNLLAIYARGAGSDLVLNSPFSGIGTLQLAAENSIQLNNSGTMSVGSFDATAGNNLSVQIGSSLLLNGENKLNTLVLPGTTLSSGGNITVNVTNDFTNISQTDFSRLRVTSSGAHIVSGGNISATIGGNLTLTAPGGEDTDFNPGDFAMVVQNTNGQIDTGGNMNLTVTGSVHVNGLNALLQNYDFSNDPAGHIGTGGNIDFEIHGDLNTATYLEIFLNNRAGGTIDTGGNLTLNIGGALTVGEGGAQIDISNRYDNTGGSTTGSTIGSDITLFVHAASVDVNGNFFDSSISNRGSLLNGSATETWSISGDVSILTDAQWAIYNDGGPGAGTPFGGTIHGNAFLQLSAANVSANSLSFQINNRNSGVSGSGGVIDSDAKITVTTPGDLVATQDFLDASIINNNTGPGSGGVIGGNAKVTLNVTGALSAHTDATFQIQNAFTASTSGGSGGMIGQDAVLTLNANSVSVGGIFDTSIRNARNAGSDGGTIGGSALINLSITGGISAFDDLQFLNNSGGTIGGDAKITVSAGSIGTTDGTAGAFSVNIANFGGRIGNGMSGGSALINFGLSGALMSASDAIFSIDNANGGSIGEAAGVAVTGTSVTTAGNLGLFVNNPNGGQIGANATVTLNASSISAGGNFFARVDNSGGGTIQGDAASSVIATGNVSAPGGIVIDILNGPSNIGGSGSVTFHAGGDVTSGASAFFDLFGEGGSVGLGFRVDVHARDISVTGDLNAYIDSNNGQIGDTANVLFVARDIHSTGNTFFDVLNAGGMIGSDATVDVTLHSAGSDGNLTADVRNQGGQIGDNARVLLNVAGDIQTGASVFFNILNAGSAIGSDAIVDVGATNISTTNGFTQTIDNQNGGSIGGNAALSLNLSGNLTTTSGAVFVQILNQSATSPGMIGGDATITLDAANIVAPGGLGVNIFNNFVATTIHGNAAITVDTGDVTTGDPTDPNLGVEIVNNFGTIDKNATIAFTATGDINHHGNAFFQILNGQSGSGSAAGHIGMNASVGVSAANVDITDDLTVGIDNTASSISGNATANFTTTGHLNAADMLFQILNSDDGASGTPGSIGGSAILTVTSHGDLNTGFLTGIISDRHAGSIGGAATIDLEVTGSLITANDVVWGISTRNDGNGGGTIGSNATVTLNAGSVASSGFLQTFISTNGGGSITGNAVNTVHATGDLSADQGILVDIEDTGFGGTGGVLQGGSIGGNAMVTLSAKNITTLSDASGTPGTDTMALEASIYSNVLGSIGGDALVNVSATQAISAPGSVFFTVANGNYQNLGQGFIGGNAKVTVTAGSLSTGDFTDDIYNYGGSTIGKGALINLNVTGSSSTGFANFDILNFNGGVINSTGNAAPGTVAGISVTGGNFDSANLFAQIDNFDGTINGDTTLHFGFSGHINSDGNENFQITNFNGGQINGGNATIDISAGSISTPNGAFSSQVFNQSGTVNGNATVQLTLSGNVSANNGANFDIWNFGGGPSPAGIINGNARIDLTAGNFLTDSGSNLSVSILNQNSGFIAGDAAVDFTLTGNLNTGNANFLIDNIGGRINAKARIDVGAANILANGGFSATIDSSANASVINADATIDIGAATISTPGAFGTIIYNEGGSVVFGKAAIDIEAGTFTTGTDNSTDLNIAIVNTGGTIVQPATIVFNATGDVHHFGNTFFQLLNGQSGSGLPGGNIGQFATIDVTAANFSTSNQLLMNLDNTGGVIDEQTRVNLTTTGNITAGNSFFQILNGDDGGTGAGSLGQSATVNVSGGANIGVTSLNAFINNFRGGIGNDGLVFVSAASINTTNDLSLYIDDRGGHISGNARTDLTVDGDIASGGNLSLQILNNGNSDFHDTGAIGGNAMINFSAVNVNANSFLAAIETGNGGTIGGDATINLDISGTLTTSGDATISIDLTPPTSRPAARSTAAGDPAINISGGSYNVGGTFLATITNNAGDINLLNGANIHADVVKIGVLGDSGTLTIGGGPITANTLLRLYAPGSNGVIDFVASCTLTSHGVAAVIAATTVTIEDGVHVTIAGVGAASVYTDNPNYMGSGGNNHTTGVFDGLGATTHPFAGAPGFDDPPPSTSVVAFSGAPPGNWSDPASWNGGVVPNNSGGILYSASQSGGTLVQDIGSGVTIQEFQMSGGVLQLDNPLHLNAGLQYAGGTINGGSLFTSGASNQAAPLTANNLTISNAGTYNLNFDNSDVFNGAVTFVNAGRVVKTNGTGAGIDTFNAIIDNTGGTFEVENGALRFVFGGSVSGTFVADTLAQIRFSNSFTIASGTTFAGAGTILIDNNVDAHVSGTLNNSSTINLVNGSNLSRIFLDGDTTLAGGGTIVLNGGNTQILGGHLLTNVDNVISGTGNMGGNLMTLSNLSNGTINANVAGQILFLDPANAGGAAFTNQGLFEATLGGILQLSGNGGGGFDNTNGTILATGDGSEIQLVQNVTINQGTLQTLNNGVIRTLAGSSAFLSNVTNAGTFLIDDNADTHINGTISNTGQFRLNPVSNLSRLILDSDTTLVGAGTIVLNGNGAQIGGGHVLTNVDNIIQGFGNVGTNSMNLVNLGNVNANVAGQVLFLDPANTGSDSFTNQGLLHSTGGILQLSGNGGGGFANFGGSIQANGSGSEVQLVQNVAIAGGALATSGGGVIRTLTGNSAFLTDVTNAGTFVIDDNADTHVNSTLNNIGTITLNPSGNLSRLVLDSDTILVAGGTIVLTSQSASSNAQITGGHVLTNVDNIISGHGNIGANSMSLTNLSGGIVNANIAGKTLFLDPSNTGASAFVNQGLFEATNGGILQLSGNGGGGFNNTAGTILANGSGSEVQLVQNSAVMGGTFDTVNNGIIRTLAGHSAFLTDVTNAGTFVIDDNADTHINDVITNSGGIALNASGNLSRLILDSDTALIGNGTINLNSNNSQIGGGHLLTNIDNLIQGQGNIGTNSMTLTNQGIIRANVSGQVLYLDPANAGPNAFINQATFEAVGGGIMQLSGNGGGGFNNAGQIIADGSGSQVQLVSSASIVSGVFNTANGGVIRTLSGNISSLTDLNNQGAFVSDDNSETHINDFINNSGSITLNAAGNFARLILDTDTTLFGAGTVTLGGNNAQIIGGHLLTNSDNLIQGQGNIGGNSMTLFNQSSGTLNANVPGQVLFLDPANTGSSAFVNQGLFEATNGGVLQLSGNGGGGFDNNSGIILADGSGSQVQLVQSAGISGGTLTTANGGIIRTLSGHIAFLTDVTNAGLFVIDDNADTHINGTINNTGSITLNAAGNLSRLILDSDSTLTGGGTVNLVSSGAQITGGQLLTNVDNVIQGQGNIGANIMALTNQSAGIVNANVNGQVLYLDPANAGAGAFTNQGLFEATNGGILQLSGNAGGGFTNTGATILASGPNSEVQLVSSASVTGGTLNTTNGGIFRIPYGHFAFLTDLTNAGTFIINDNADAHINGTINNTGSIALNTAGNLTRLILDSHSMLTGGGTITLAGGAAQITGGSSLTNVDNVIQGQGNIGANVMILLNQSAGTVNANVSGAVLYLDPANAGTTAFSNAGIFEATNGGILELSGNGGGGFSSSGTIHAASGGTVRVSAGGSVNSSGMTKIDGSGSALGLQNGSSFDNSGTFLVQNNGSINGSSGATLTNEGTFTRDTGTGSFTIDSGVVFRNTGTVNVASGTLLIQGGDGGGGSTGVFNVSNGATLQVDTNGIDQGPSQGAINLNNGTFTVAGAIFFHAHQITGTLGTINAITGTLTTASGINFNGNDADNFNLPTNGGHLTYNTTSISFDPVGTIQGPLTFNGGAGFTASGGGVVPAASGGTFTVNATGVIAVDSDIEATTGIEPSGVTQSGAGGTVNLTSTGDEVLVRGRIEVSSNDANRRSGSGGFINILSGAAGGTAIDIQSTAQLLSLMGSAAGGAITLQATGASSEIDVKGAVEADFGTVDIEQTGANGVIALGDTMNTFTLRGDTVKVAALGSSGVLNIGQGTINADTMLKLYAGGSNGTINFNASVTLSGNSTKIIASKTINIFHDVILTINGPTAAQIYTDNPNYAVESGGNGIHDGTIQGTAGANAPAPFSSAPGFGTSASASTVAKSGSSVTAAGNAPAPATTASNNTSTGVKVSDTNELLDLINAGSASSPTGTRKHLQNPDRKRTHHDGNRLPDGRSRRDVSVPSSESSKQSSMPLQTTGAR